MALQLSVTAFADTAVETYTLGGLMIEVEPVEAPKAASGLNYNGKEQAGAALPGLDQKYRLRSGVKSAVKPGSYEMELELIEPLPENIGRCVPRWQFLPPRHCFFWRLPRLPVPRKVPSPWYSVPSAVQLPSVFSEAAEKFSLLSRFPGGRECGMPSRVRLPWPGWYFAAERRFPAAICRLR